MHLRAFITSGIHEGLLLETKAAAILIGVMQLSFVVMWLLLDAEVLMGPSRVVAGSQDEAAVCLATVAVPDDG